MRNYKLSQSTNLHIINTQGDECYQYAVDETTRLLAKVEITIDETKATTSTIPFILGVGEFISPVDSLPEYLKWDGYALNVTTGGITICANSAKGILNGVYDLAERIGFAFLLPGEKGESTPVNVASLMIGEEIVNPRFPYRGVFWSKLDFEDFPDNEWLEFYAKLRFNSLRYSGEVDNKTITKLGLRNEIGGHGLSKFLPRDMFEEEPELFRMFQPDDFGGKRMNDSNLCITNAKTRQIVKESFKKVLEENEGAYAIHAWADDLPAGGWCLCPTCRAFSAEDQAMLAMRLLAEAVKETGSKVKIPALAYHDTMFPGTQFDAPKESFLLFAPRERCYGHALDDPNCEQNKYYMQSLKEWMIKYEGIEDPHTFEYYFDQILFRGIYPFLPSVIAGDMTAYQHAGIETHMALQVGGAEIAPEYNMLAFSALHWNENLSASDFCRNISMKITGEENNALFSYLTKRGEAFERAMQFCGHDPKVYMDYRWLPETTSSFGQEIAEIYQQSAEDLNTAATELENSFADTESEFLKDLISTEVKRARFEAEELKVMHYQQQAMNSIAQLLNSEKGEDHIADICSSLEKAIKTLEVAKIKAHDYEIPEGSWYFNSINKWLTKEFQTKIDNYKQYT